MDSFPLFTSLLFFFLKTIREIDLDPKLFPQSIDTSTMCADDAPYELSIDVELNTKWILGIFWVR